MGHAIKCYFTPGTAGPIRKIWEALAEARLADFMITSNSKPGVTFAVWENTREENLLELLKKFVATKPRALHIRTFGMATFPTDPAQVFLGVVPSPELLAMHVGFHALDPALSAACTDYYKPGNWVPHSTVAMRCDPAHITRIIEKCLEFNTRLEAKICAVALIETVSAHQIAEFKI